MTTDDREKWLAYAAQYRSMGIEPAAEACQKMAAEAGEEICNRDVEVEPCMDVARVQVLLANAKPGETVRVIVTRLAEEAGACEKMAEEVGDVLFKGDAWLHDNDPQRKATPFIMRLLPGHECADKWYNLPGQEVHVLVTRKAEES